MEIALTITAVVTETMPSSIESLDVAICCKTTQRNEHMMKLISQTRLGQLKDNSETPLL